MKRIPLKIRKSNWETVAFLVIYDLLITTGKKFNRSALMTSENINKSINWLNRLGHKRDPEHPEETLQRTIQNLRDKGYIIFDEQEQGRYELTDEGVKECHRIVNEFNTQLSNIDEAIEQIKNEYQIEQAKEVRKQVEKMTPDEKNNILKKLDMDENNGN